MPTCPYLDPIKPSKGGWSLAHPYTVFLTILLMSAVILAHRTTITVTLQVAAAPFGGPAPPTSLSTTPHLPLSVNSGHLPPSTTFDALKLQSFPPLWPHPLPVWPGALSLAWSHTDTPPMQCSCCPYAHRHGDPAPVYCPPAATPQLNPGNKLTKKKKRKGQDPYIKEIWFNLRFGHFIILLNR